MDSTLFLIFALLSIAIVLFLLFLVLFEPALRYRVRPPQLPLGSEGFVALVGALSDSAVYRHSRVEVLEGGPAFYEAELAAIRSAKRNVHIEAFLFTPGGITDRFVEALTERAQAGVKVRVVLDWLGCFLTPNSYFTQLRAAGGQVLWYQPPRWYTFKRLNNRTHRELIVVDGEIGFIGGAGIADHWLGGHKGERPWHDLMCRVEGDLVLGLQTTFCENWLESCGEILAGEDEFPAAAARSATAGIDVAAAPPSGDDLRGLVVISTPSAARSTRARVLFQTLLAAAEKSILINSPYFLPDSSAIAELIRAAKERGVAVKVCTPGESNNHPLARRASRRRYGDLLKAGVEIHEYQPGMIHKKALVVDGVWSVVGSTNFDMRSFGLNDEVNLAAVDRPLAERLASDFSNEVAQSRQISYEEWLRRPLSERILAALGRVLERQE